MLERRKFYNRKGGSCDGDSIERVGRHAGYFLRQNEVHGKGEPGRLTMLDRHDAEPSHLDLARKGWRRRGCKASIVLPLDPHLIVCDEKRLEPRLRREREKAEREVGLAAAGRPADERRVRPQRHAGAMDQLPPFAHVNLGAVMAGLGPAIHVFSLFAKFVGARKFARA